MRRAAPVKFAEICVGPETLAKTRDLGNGEVLLCENVGFQPGEETNEAGLAKALAKLGDICVNDACSCAHRAHASTAGVSAWLASFAGPLMAEEIEALSRALETPGRSFVAIVGGAKVPSKISVPKTLWPIWMR